MNYITNTLNNASFEVRTNPNCNKYSRCNKFKTCKKCNLIREKEVKKSLEHLQEKDIIKFSCKKYIVVTSNDLDIAVDEKNANINMFRKALTEKKINKHFCINKYSQYFITKEISYNSKFGYNPHLNIVLLQDFDFDANNKQLLKLLDLLNLSLHVEDIYKRDNSYKNSINKIISYSIKFDKNRALLELDNPITHNQRDIFKSNFFKKKKSLSYLHNLLFNLNVFKRLNIKKSQSYLYIYIRALKEQTKKDIYNAKAIFKRNANKTHTKNYIRLLKSLKKKKILIFAREARKTKRAAARFRAYFP